MCVVAALGTPVSAHGVISETWNTPRALSPWDIAAVLVLTVAGLLYVRGTMVRRIRGAAPRRREWMAFACGWSTLMLAALPPIDARAIQQFSVHMVQHELMMLVAAPLIIAGRPIATVLWGLPSDWRGAVSRVLRAKGGGRLLLASSPLVAWAAHGLVIWLWHIPALYDAAVSNEAIHASQHAMFVATAALFWWGMLSGRYGRAGYGAAVFYVFTTVVHTGLLGAMLTLAPVPLYPIYATAAARNGHDALEDQQLAGLLMWIPAGTILTALGIALCAAWLGEAARRQRITAPRS